MGIKDQLETDMNAFFVNIENQTAEDKKKTLAILMDKYIHLFSAPILLDKYDFDMIKDHAISFLKNNAPSKKIGSKRQEVRSGEMNILATIEATIMRLNYRECLRKLPKFDYRD